MNLSLLHEHFDGCGYTLHYISQESKLCLANDIVPDLYSLDVNTWEAKAVLVCSWEKPSKERQQYLDLLVSIDKNLLQKAIASDDPRQEDDVTMFKWQDDALRVSYRPRNSFKVLRNGERITPYWFDNKAECLSFATERLTNELSIREENIERLENEIQENQCRIEKAKKTIAEIEGIFEEITGDV